MTDYAQVLDYLTQYSKAYRELLDLVKDAAEFALKNLGSNVIADIYDRPDEGMGPFKDPRKIAAKLRKRGNYSARAFLELNDIIALTVVFKYRDQLPAVIAAIRRGLGGRHVKMGAPESHENKKGYFADHVICSRIYGTDTLKCEVQLKTMLHDAWAKKMHDLTYKPGGRLDHRLAALMETGSATLESVERQSLLFRDLIQANWNVEKEARRQAREHIFKAILEYSSRLWEGAEDATQIEELHQKIESATSWLQDEPADSERLETLRRRVGDCCRRQELVRFGWILAGRLATIRPDVGTVRSCALSTDEWLRVAPALLQDGQVEAREMLAVPLMFYSMNELDLSIDYTDKILGDPRFNILPGEDRAKLIFNRANFLVEREYHFPTEDRGERSKLQEEVVKALSIEGLADEDQETAIRDLEGMIDITFATTTEEVGVGIRKCGEAERLSSPDEQDLSEAYANLNMRLGWRRYFELEVEEQAALASVVRSRGPSGSRGL